MQTGYEFGTVRELNFNPNGYLASDPASITYPITDSFSVSGTQAGAGGQWVAAGATQMRVGFHAYPFGGQNVQTQRLFSFWCPVSGVGNARFEIFARRTGYWELMYYDPSDGTLTSLEIAPIWINGFANQDAYVAFGFTINTDAGDPYLSMYLNGRHVINYTGSLLTSVLDVRGFDIHRHGIFESNSFFYGFDDVWADVSTGSESDSVPPNPRFVMLSPSADGSTTQWTASGGGDHNDDVNEAPPQDTSFVHTTTSGHIEYFGVAPASDMDFHPMQAVIPSARVLKGDAQMASWFRLKIREGITTNVSNGGTFTDLPSSYEYVFSRFTTDPNGDPWDAANVNNCEYGFESQGTL